MSLYSEYLDAKSDVFSKELAFKAEVETWLDENNIPLKQPLKVEENLTIDNFQIVTDKIFLEYVDLFEESFNVKCVNIFHTERIIPGESTIEEFWKFNFIGE